MLALITFPRQSTGLHRLAVALMAALISCDGPTPIDPDIPLPTSCSDDGGTVHSGGLDGTLWYAADGPHRIRDTVAGGRLTIEPGALVCAGPGAALEIGWLTAEGTADEPITFTAEDPSRPWAGIKTSSTTLQYGLLEHAEVGVQGSSGSNISIRHSTIRQVQGQAVLFGDTGHGLLVETVIDSTCLSMCPGAGPFAAAVVVLSDVDFHFEDSQILNSGAGGMVVQSRSDIAILGGRIEGSVGMGMDLRDDATGGRRVTVTDARPIVITGGGSYPARTSVTNAAMLLDTRVAQEGWLGNAADTVLVTSVRSNTEHVTIHPGLTWSVSGSALNPAQIATLELEPGAALVVSRGTGLLVGHIISRGTAAEPVEIGSDLDTASPVIIWSQVELPDTSRLSHTRFTGTRLDVRRPAVLENVTVEGGDIAVTADGTRLAGIRVIGTDSPATAALTLGALHVQVLLCEITGSVGDGVRVEVADGVRIRNCNIANNAGVGVRNTAVQSVDARDNWWGDAAGPTGQTGDGVAGNVDFLPFLTEPVDFGSTG